MAYSHYNIQPQVIEPSWIESFADLFIVSLYGGMVAYTHLYIHPLPLFVQLIATGLLAFFLGTLGPQVDEIVEWLFFFSFGVILASLSPQIFDFFKTGHYSIGQIVQLSRQSLPYLLQILSPWTFALPMGLAFYKISHHQHYRHSRFF